MKSKIIPIVFVCFLLAFTIVAAKSIGDVEPIDWKTKRLIKADGVYNTATKEKIKDVAKAEIWIDKYVEEEKSYHVDSVIKEDTTVDIELFYEIQPDEITYESHNGKYKQIYTYNDWDWKEKGNNQTGGYVIISDVILEYGLGSNTFTDAISGATWQNDGVDVTLTENTDYTLSGSTFTLANINYAWTGITGIWDYQIKKIFHNITYDSQIELEGNTSIAGMMLTISLIGIVLGTLIGIFVISRRKKI